MKKQLKPREYKLLQLLCKDKTNVECAKIMKLNRRSIERLRTKIYKKTKTKSMLTLYKWSILQGIAVVRRERTPLSYKDYLMFSNSDNPIAFLSSPTTNKYTDNQ